MKKVVMWVNNKGELFGYQSDCAKSEGLFECPRCKGAGVNQVKYNAYPSGLPDSGWVEDWKYKEVTCEVCEGRGYTLTEKRAVTKIVGYE